MCEPITDLILISLQASLGDLKHVTSSKPQTFNIGRQSSADELMYTIPFLDTVAGEALSML